jgi:uncharacterized protein YndB with AHSA1/START domain
MSTNATALVRATPDEVFAQLTDVDRLPSWNTELVEVLERPERLLPGTEFVVRMHAAGMTWPSRTRVLEVDPARRHLVYRSVSDDGNPSFTIWTWDVAPHPAGAEVTVAWDPNPRTLMRRCIVVHWRRRCLRRQVPRSLRSLAAAVESVSR